MRLSGVGPSELDVNPAETGILDTPEVSLGGQDREKNLEQLTEEHLVKGMALGCTTQDR
ncbi:MAG: hypothetical protein R6U57_00260 [Anaerolineales bacterium]